MIPIESDPDKRVCQGNINSLAGFDNSTMFMLVLPDPPQYPIGENSTGNANYNIGKLVFDASCDECGKNNMQDQNFYDLISNQYQDQK